MRNARDYGNIVSRFLSLRTSYACIKNETYKQMIDEKIEEILHNTKAS